MSFKNLRIIAFFALGLYSPSIAQTTAWSGYISYFDAGGTLRNEPKVPICNFVKNGSCRIDPPVNATIRAQYYTNFEFNTPICVDDNFTFETKVRNGALVNGVAAYDMILDLKTPSGFTSYTLMAEAWAQQWTNLNVGGETVLNNSPNLIVNYANWTVLKLSFKNKTVTFSADDKVLVTKAYNSNVCNLNGFFMRFKGSAAVDYIKITNDDDKTIVYDEQFSSCTDMAKPIACTTNIEATANTPCEGDILKLATTARARNYDWTGPNNFRSSSKEPIVPKTDNSTAGVYTLKAQMNACQFLTKTIDVAINPKPVVNLGNDTAICNGVAYTLDAKNQGSTYKWHNNTTNRLLSVKNSGTYIVTVTSPAGCVAADTIKIDIPTTAISANVTVKKPSCYGKCDGEIATKPTGGFGAPYSYRWSGGRTTQDLLSRCAGDVNLTVTDSKGCKLETIASVSQPLKIEVKAFADTIYNGYAVRCHNSQDGQATVKPQGGAGNFTVVWNTTPFQTDRTATGLRPDTTYKVVVFDKNGCSDSTTVRLTAPPPIVAEYSTKSPRCYGDKDGEITVEKIKGGTAPYFFSFEEKKYPFDGTPIRLKNLVSGAYFFVASDANGCTQPQNVEIIAPPKMSIVSTEDTLIHFGDDIVLFANVATPSVLGGVKWSSSRDSVGLDCKNCPSVKVSPRLTTFFNVIVKDSFGCEAKKQILIKVDKQRRIFVPTAFSPNEDGINDYIMVHSGRGARKIHNFSVFNRWGSLVHQVKNITPNDDSMSWDGRFRGKELPSDLYIWFIEVEFEDGEKEIFKGDFSLVR